LHVIDPRDDLVLLAFQISKIGLGCAIHVEVEDKNNIPAAYTEVRYDPRKAHGMLPGIMQIL
jgi:hypothetical protein